MLLIGWMSTGNYFTMQEWTTIYFVVILILLLWEYQARHLFSMKTRNRMQGSSCGDYSFMLHPIISMITYGYFSCTIITLSVNHNFATNHVKNWRQLQRGVTITDNHNFVGLSTKWWWNWYRQSIIMLFPLYIYVCNSLLRY